ncbi:MAG: ATP-binding protein [bacterium]|nr:ATP-binding protein [bacterium]
MYLRRKIDDELVRWKAREDRLPLILKGARQVGKTECVRHFAAATYASLIEINFVERPDFKEIVRDGFSVESVVRNMSMTDPTLRFVPGRTLIFFDEIQEFPEIATSLKFFAQDGRYDVIASGSLLGVHFKRIKSYSVGYQESIRMRSLDFEEFLWACGYREDQIADLLEPIFSRRPFSMATKAAMDRRFLDYCVLGGMPDVLETYFVKGTFERVPFTQGRILEDYREDVRKYAEGLDPVRIQSVFDSIPRQLAKDNHKFQWAAIRRGAGAKDYWGCVEWLEDAGVVEKSKALDFPELPMGAHLQADAFRLYMGDSGLLLSMLEEPVQEDVRVRRNLGTWKGALFENIVGEALAKAGATLGYYRKENSTLEIDFLLRAKDGLVPVEVKGENKRAQSLRTLIKGESYRDISWGIKLVNGNVGFEDNVLTLPQWCAFLLPKVVDEFCRD